MGISSFVEASDVAGGKGNRGCMTRYSAARRRDNSACGVKDASEASSDKNWNSFPRVQHGSCSREEGSVSRYGYKLH